MRTTVNIADDLLAQVKLLAMKNNDSLGHVVDDALRAYLAKRERPVVDFAWSQVAIDIPGGSGMRPGINWRSNSEMLDLMDQT